MTDKKAIVIEAKKRFEKARDYYADSRKLAIADTRFVMGDSDNGWQWPEAQAKDRQGSKRVCLTVNMTAQHCNQIINQIRQNRPAVKVSPADDGADKETAEILGGLIRNIQVASAADDAHDTAAEHAVYGGEGYWRILTEYENESSFNQVIRVKACPNPNLVFIDPNALAHDKSDAEWGFVFESISKEQGKREHPTIDPSSWGGIDGVWVNEDSFQRAEYFYCEFVDDVACLLQDGQTVLKTELAEGEIVVKERPTKVKKWKWCKLIGGHDVPVDEQEWLGSYLPIIAVVGKELNVNGEIVRKGIVRDLKDPARMVNYAYSETVQTLALQNKVPYMAAAESMEGHEDIWDSANIETRTYLPFNAYDATGNPLPKPDRQMPAVMPAAQVQLLQLSTEQMRAASGQQNSNFGIRSEASSGVGIQRLKQQGEVATFHFPDNLARALRYEAKVLIDLIRKYYDTKRVVRILGLDGKEESATLDPRQDGAYQEQETQEQEIQRIFNPLVGEYDVVIDTGPSYQTQRQEAYANLTELASRSPQLMQVAGDLVMRSADFPMADKLAERLEKTLAPELRDEKPGQKQQVPPEVQQHMAEQDKQIKMLGDALEAAAGHAEQLELDSKSKEAELGIKAFDAETNRLKVIGAAMTPEQVQAMVMQTIQQVMNAPTPYAGIDEIYEEEPPQMEAMEHQAMPPEPQEQMQQEQPADAGFSLPEEGQVS
tara:strand:+ start:2060 stop:4204 length:2145 start_codon:yes stop_codon:yes gene_type:complete